MKETGKKCIGIDISDVMTQISEYDYEKKEPVAVGFRYGSDVIYEIPVVMGCSSSEEKNSGEGQGRRYWYFGKKAEELEKTEGFTVFRNFVSAAADEKHRETGEKASEVFKRYLDDLMVVITARYRNTDDCMITFTFDEVSDRLEADIEEVLLKKGIKKSGFQIIDHKKSYMYYAVNQKEELWRNNVGLFSFRRDPDDLSVRLDYTQLNIDRTSLPCIVSARQRDLTEKAGLQGESGLTERQRVNLFTNMADAIFYRNAVTTVYITGSRYAGPWLDRSLKSLCRGRRIFKGENLYTRGACFASLKKMYGSEEDPLLMDERGIPANIFLKVYTDGKIRDIPVVKAGTPWENVDISFDIIPYDEDELTLTVENIVTRQKKIHLLSMTSVEGKNDRMSRYTFRIRFSGADECIVTLRDRGFGEFRPSTNRIWERTFKI